MCFTSDPEVHSQGSVFSHSPHPPGCFYSQVLVSRHIQPLGRCKQKSHGNKEGTGYEACAIAGVSFPQTAET